MKRNIFQRMNQCQIYLHIFFGYVQGRLEAGDSEKINVMARDFLTKYGIDDTDEKTILTGYYNYFDRFKEFIREGRK
jgi:hypothetical protein